MIWKPNVTVAAIIERDGKFLLVEEETAEGVMFNQPAGHLEENESLLDAVVREAWEETAHRFEPTALLGVYHWKHPRKDVTFLRFAFIGNVSGHDPQQPLDQGILRTCWLAPEEVRDRAERLRSPQVLSCIEHYLEGRRYPLSVITHL